MKRSTLLWPGAAIVGLALVGLTRQIVLPSSASPRERATTAGPADRAGAASPADTTRLRAEVAALRAQVAGLDQAPAPEAEPVMTEEERRAEDDRRHAAYMDRVEAGFEREAVDPTWSSSTATRVWSTIKQMDVIHAAARTVECRSKSCRIEVRDDGTGALHKGLPMFAQEFADAMPYMAGRQVQEPDGHAGMVLYLMGPELAQVGERSN
jgi:hypothetical protein